MNDDFIPICVPENAAEIRAMYKRQRERVAELEAEKTLAWPLMETGLLAANAHIAELDAENNALRRDIDNIKVRSYELGQRELHDMALAALTKEDL